MTIDTLDLARAALNDFFCKYGRDPQTIEDFREVTATMKRMELIRLAANPGLAAIDAILEEEWIEA